jgi:hypothetical protein
VSKKVSKISCIFCSMKHKLLVLCGVLVGIWKEAVMNSLREYSRSYLEEMRRTKTATIRIINTRSAVQDCYPLHCNVQLTHDLYHVAGIQSQGPF